MKTIAIALAALMAISTGAEAKSTRSSSGSHSVAGHTTKKGTHVAATRATNPDKSKTNNYSHKGNVNPYTGKKGTKK